MFSKQQVTLRPEYLENDIVFIVILLKLLNTVVFHKLYI